MKPHRRFLRLALPALALALAACAGFYDSMFDRADHIKVPHPRHLKAEVDCSTCHETIFDSTDLSTVDLPKEKKCTGCHKDEKAAGKCGFCHTRPDKPATLTGHPRALKMNHSEHIERVKEDCQYCHKVLPDPLRTDGMAPKMATCFTCHEHQAQWDNGQCEVCHKDLTIYGPKPVSAFSHRNNWLHDHGQEARSGAETCANCHEQSFCSDCHAKTDALRVDLILPERVDHSFIHRNDWLGRHSTEAQADPAMCQRCHGVDFCQACHAKNGLVPGAPDGLNPHPKGFGQGPAHGAAARNDIVSCAACHDQGAASICVKCHQVGGVGGNPHPAAFITRHPHEEIAKNAMCQVCHH